MDSVIGMLNSPKPIQCLVGLDGFVDEVVHVVDKRYDGHTFSRIETLSAYANRIMSGAGLSINIEMVPIQKKIGGNGPILAMGLLQLGLDVTFIGCLGQDTIHPIFQDLVQRADVVSFAEPGYTDAVEFLDGKIIRSKVNALNTLSWKRIIEKLSVSDLAVLFSRADLLSFNNWTCIMEMNSIWEKMLSEVVPLMTAPPEGKTIFFDLADPEKRMSEELREALERIRAFHTAGFRTVIGMNKRESCQIAELLGLHIENRSMCSLEELAHHLMAQLALDAIVIHAVDKACMYDGKAYVEIDGPYCSHPVITTGAGDIFNSGFLFGLMQGAAMEDCLLLGCAASGYYVRHADMADHEQLGAFISKWKSDKGEI